MRTNLDDDQDWADAHDQLMEGSHNPFEPRNFLEAITNAEIPDEPLREVLDNSDWAEVGFYLKNIAIEYWAAQADKTLQEMIHDSSSQA